MSPASEVRASGRLAVPAAFLHSPAPGSARAGGSGTPGARPAPGPVRRAGSRRVRAEDVEVTEPPKVTSGEAATPRPQPAGNRALPAVLGRSVFQGEAAVAGSAGTPGSRARGGAGPQQTRGHTSCAGAARRNDGAFREAARACARPRRGRELPGAGFLLPREPGARRSASHSGRSAPLPASPGAVLAVQFHTLRSTFTFIFKFYPPAPLLAPYLLPAWLLHEKPLTAPPPPEVFVFLLFLCTPFVFQLLSTMMCWRQVLVPPSYLAHSKFKHIIWDRNLEL